MNYQPKHRHSIRLQGYDYRLDGVYYVTICSHQRRCLFGEIVEENMKKNLLGDTIEAVWFRLPLHFPFIQLDAFIVMPNHIHGIVVIHNQDLEKSEDKEITQSQDGYQHPRGTIRKSLGAIVQNFKSISTRKINRLCCDRLTIWQRNYYEHIIRNEESYQKIRQYILDNPRNWERDENNLEKFKPI